MNIDIKGIVVLVTEGSMDRVIIDCGNLPASVYPYNGCADLMMYVAHGEGVEYVRDNFKIEPEVKVL